MKKQRLWYDDTNYNEWMIYIYELMNDKSMSYWNMNLWSSLPEFNVDSYVSPSDLKLVFTITAKHDSLHKMKGKKWLWWQAPR